MKDILEYYLKEQIDSNIIIKPWNEKEYLPMFLSEIYTFYRMNILGESCLLIEINSEIPGIELIKKHIKVISKSVDYKLVFFFKSLSAFRRKTLIENRIPFVVENGQMYFPFLGMDIKMTKDENIKIIEKFSSSTQLVFLYFLYNKDLLINTTELAGKLVASTMTASRALNDLYLLGLLTYEVSGKTGRSKIYKRIDDTDYYDRGSKYLKNPVSKVVYVDKDIACDFLVAGLEALSTESMLNPPKRPVRAMAKQYVKNIKEHIVANKDKIADMDLIEFQLWEYNPNSLSKNEVVDLVSLIMSIGKSNDERVEIAIEERLRSELWYMG
jgi:predicted transcriptional regulator